jgi:hypothetical protein
MRKDYVCSAALILALSIVIMMSNKVNGAEGNKMNVNKFAAMSVFDTYDELSKKLKSVELPKQEEKPKRPNFKINIPLSDELLDYIYDLCEKNDIPYTLILAIAGVESDYDFNAVSRTHDFGMMQVHSTNIKDFAQEAGIENVDPFNPKHSVQMAMVYLKYLKNYWNQYDMSEEQKFFCVVLSYNIGENKVIDYIKKCGYNNTYVSKVEKLKGYLEQNEVFE